MNHRICGIFQNKDQAIRILLLPYLKKKHENNVIVISGRSKQARGNQLNFINSALRTKTILDNSYPISAVAVPRIPTDRIIKTLNTNSGLKIYYGLHNISPRIYSETGKL